MNNASLLTRLALVIGLTSVVIGLISSQVVYYLTVQQEKHLADERIAELFLTVKQTASTAAYLEQQGIELAQEVLDGLANNRIVDAARFVSGDVDIHSHQRGLPAVAPQVFAIPSLFDPDASLGQIMIYPNLKVITERAETIARENALAMLLLEFVPGKD